MSKVESIGDILKRRYGPDYFKDIAKKSWKNKSRNRKVGFATLDPETLKAVSSKGGKRGKKTKKKKLAQSSAKGS